MTGRWEEWQGRCCDVLRPSHHTCRMEGHQQWSGRVGAGAERVVNPGPWRGLGVWDIES